MILALWLWRREAEARLGAARRALLRRHPRRPALRPQQRRPARHADPLGRLLPVRQRALGAPAAVRARPAGRRPRPLRRAADRRRHRCRGRRAAAAAAEGAARCRPDGGVWARRRWRWPWRRWRCSRVVAVALPACVLAGLAWIAVLSSLNVSAQMALPGWVRSRGLAVNLAVFFGSMALGSIVWGWLAGRRWASPAPCWSPPPAPCSASPPPGAGSCSAAPPLDLVALGALAGADPGRAGGGRGRAGAGHRRVRDRPR